MNQPNRRRPILPKGRAPPFHNRPTFQQGAGPKPVPSHGAILPTASEIIRKQFKVSKLCQVFQGILEPCTEEGFARHRLHTLPSIALFEDDGRELVVHAPELACIFGLARQSPLNVPSQDLRAFKRQPPFEAVYLTMALGDSTKDIPRRIRLLQEAEVLLLDLCEQRTALLVVAISHRRLIHGRIVIRHQPVSILDLDGGILWLHPAAQRFGLIEASFPRSQRHRQVGRTRPCRDRNPLADLRQDAEGLPPW